MLNILKSQLPADEATLRAALVKYKDAIEAHARTVGEPAPWPEFDSILEIIAAGGDFIVTDDLETRPLSAREKLLVQLDEIDRRTGTTRAVRALAKIIADALPGASADVTVQKVLAAEDEATALRTQLAALPTEATDLVVDL